MTASDAWPSLPLDAWERTRATLHMYAQIVGKIRLAAAPFEPQWANVPLYVTARGLTTSPMRAGERAFQIDFDFVSHAAVVTVSDGRARSIPLLPAISVADFYAVLMASLHGLGIHVAIWTMPQEIADPIPFPEDSVHATYDPEYVSRFLRVLTLADAALKAYRAPFRERHTPVQFFWGTFDLAYARFSGRPATPPSDDVIAKNAMDAEEICTGFWAGDKRFPEPAFWCYAYPKPAGLEKLTVLPRAAFWSDTMGEFLLRYEDVRNSASPFDTILEFLRSAYDACSAQAKWPAG